MDWLDGFVVVRLVASWRILSPAFGAGSWLRLLVYVEKLAEHFEEDGEAAIACAEHVVLNCS